MNVNDILTLAKAGFNAAQITALATAVTPTPAPAPAPAPVTAPAPAPVTAPTPAPAPTPVTMTTPASIPAPTATPNNNADLTEVLNQLGVMQTAMQSMALSGAQQPKPESTDDILASIINPPVLDKK